MKTIKNSFEEHARVMADAATVLPAILDRVAADLHACFARDNKLLACGNGGSASDAEHLVAELVGRYRDERRGLPAITLVSGSATVTALANDYGYERVFARQVEALARPVPVMGRTRAWARDCVFIAADGRRRRGHRRTRLDLRPDPGASPGSGACND
ncbi:MAG: SIS domain-containing protein [Steroidobacteraceae bacterium]